MPSKKIYISRKNSKSRNVSNNVEFNTLIKSYGFEDINAEDYTLKDIVLLLINTKYLIGVCGANLTHAIFMKKKGFLIELIHKNYVHEHPWPGQYEEQYYGLHRSYIANSLSLNYLYIPCNPSNDINEYSGDPMQENLFVDLNELKNQLDRIM
jgi:capsular polysaccharide biosynthesis protein